MTYLTRDAITADLEAVLAIERLSFSDPWTLGMLRGYLREHKANEHISQASGDRRGSSEVAHIFLVGCDVRGASTVAGYAVGQIVGEDAELLDIAVAPSHRGGGLGTLLLDTLVHRCAEQGATTMFLEVRESNAAALSLYTRRGFMIAGRRPRYYRLPTEDALIMNVQIDPSSTQTL